MNHPTDVGEIVPALDRVPVELATAAVAYDTGYWREANVTALAQRGLDPYIATGRLGHWRN